MTRTVQCIHWLCVLVLMNLSAKAMADQIWIRPYSNVTRVSTKSDGHNYSISETDDRYGDEAYYNPTPDERKRMRVEWGKPSQGYLDHDQVREDEHDLWTLWVQTNELTPERKLLVGGRLLLESPDGKSAKPITWIQGVNVVVARRPRVHLDWSERHDEDTAASWHCVTDKEGRFHVLFNVGQVLRTPGREELFQVGLSLGIKDGNTITWKNTVPVLPQSVSKIRLQGPPKLSPVQEAINGANQFPSQLGLIRAVNQLQILGKERAITELRKFLDSAPEFSTSRICVPENIDTADPESLDAIVRLLFEPAKASKPTPPVWNIFYRDVDGNELDNSIWPHFPFVVAQGIPFLVAWPEGSGRPPDPKWILDWAEKHGKLRAQLLSPGSDPFTAAAEVVTQVEAHRLSNLGFRQQLVLDQAWGLIMEICAELPMAKQPPRVLIEPNDESAWEADWPARKAFAATLKLQWNPDRQAYELK